MEEGGKEEAIPTPGSPLLPPPPSPLSPLQLPLSAGKGGGGSPLKGQRQGSLMPLAIPKTKPQQQLGEQPKPVFQHCQPSQFIHSFTQPLLPQTSNLGDTAAAAILTCGIIVATFLHLTRLLSILQQSREQSLVDRLRSLITLTPSQLQALLFKLARLSRGPTK